MECRFFLGLTQYGVERPQTWSSWSLIVIWIGLLTSTPYNLFMPNLSLQFIGATMGSSELHIQADNGQVGMPSNVCCVVVEYCPGGALKSYLIKNRRRKLAFKLVVQLALDLARGSYSRTPSLFYFSLWIFDIFKPFQLPRRHVSFYILNLFFERAEFLYFFNVRIELPVSVFFVVCAIFIRRRLFTEMLKQKTCFWTRHEL